MQSDGFHRENHRSPQIHRRRRGGKIGGSVLWMREGDLEERRRLPLPIIILAYFLPLLLRQRHHLHRCRHRPCTHAVLLNACSSASSTALLSASTSSAGCRSYHGHSSKLEAHLCKQTMIHLTSAYSLLI